MIDENNLKQELFDYAMEKYGNDMPLFFEKFEDEFPYKVENVDEELFLKDFIDWLMIEKPLPETGKTIVEEYVADHPEMDSVMKNKLLHMKDIVRSEFIVIARQKREIKLKDRETEKMYRVKLWEKQPFMQSNTLIRGRIFPFGEYYRFAGILSIAQSPMILDSDIFMEVIEKRQKQNAENIILSPYITTTATLNKYPAQWIDGVCQALSMSTQGVKREKAKSIAEKLASSLREIVEKLPKKAQEALQLITEKGGYVKYNQLKAYDDEMSFWWKDRPPASTIGLLRLHGLIIVGKMPLASKFYKVAVIPKEVKEGLERIWSQSNQHQKTNPIE